MVIAKPLNAILSDHIMAVGFAVRVGDNAVANLGESTTKPSTEYPSLSLKL